MSCFANRFFLFLHIAEFLTATKVALPALASGEMSSPIEKSCYLESIQGDDEWSYEDSQTWPGICQNGTSQSPINIGRTGEINVEHV